MKKSSKDLGISGRISEMRKHFKLSAEALGEKAGVSGTAIANIERGDSLNPGAEMLASISTMLGVNLNWLLLGEGKMLKSPTSSQQTQDISSYGDSVPLLGAGQTGVAEGLQSRYPTHDVAGPGDINFSLPPSKKQKKPVGTDLIREIQNHSTQLEQVTADIQRIFQMLRGGDSVGPDAPDSNTPGPADARHRP